VGPRAVLDEVVKRKIPASRTKYSLCTDRVRLLLDFEVLVSIVLLYKET
jgi:hypothetical protein